MDQMEGYQITAGTGGAVAAKKAAVPAVMSDPHPWKWEEDDYTVYRGTARTPPGCHNDCGILMYVKNGKLEKVEGDPEHPYNNGRLCPRCLALVDYVYHEKRVVHPMKRSKIDRGKDAWERTTWDDAYGIIKKEMGAIAKKHGAESVIFGQGTGRDILYLFRLAYSYGSPNEGNPWFTGQACYLPRIASMALMQGAPCVADCSQFLPLRFDDPEYRVPEFMLIWGNNPIKSNPDGFLGHWVTDLMKRGMDVGCIDPELSWFAAKSGEYWLRLRPGTDGAIAMGMLKVILEEEIYDKGFCNKWVYGIDELKARVAEYSLDDLAEISWVPKAKIIALARRYATAKPATIQWGVAVDHSTGGVEAAFAISALWIITGNLDIPGGQVIGPPCWGIEQANWTGGWGYDDVLPLEKKDKRFGVQDYPMFNTGYLNPQPDIATEAVMTGKPYEVHGLWLQTSNFLVGMGVQGHKVLEYYKKLDFIVCVDLVMTPTAMELADIFLPACTYAERIGFGGMQPYFIGAITQAINPVGESRSDMRIIKEVGEMFNPDAWPWENEEQINDSLLAQGGFTYKDLVESTWKYPKFEYHKYEKGLLREDGQMGFNTPTGRLEVYSLAYRSFGYDPLPSYVEPYDSPISNADLTEEYPYVLTSGTRIPLFFHSEQRHIEKLRRLHPDPLCYIHPDTAARHGIEEGEWFYLENTLGRCKYKASFNATYDPRVLQCEHGWWFPEKSPVDEGEGCFGGWKANVNLLIRQKCGVTGFGGGYKTMICKIYKTEDQKGGI
jgi:anaerobic selenocysteine-containing dehydrogenase